MSFEGFDEYLCANGHYLSADVRDAAPACPCGAPLSWHHLVDQTNGYDERHPSTRRGRLKEVGFDDVWHEDHHGNRYATKRPTFQPQAKEWQPVDSKL